MDLIGEDNIDLEALLFRAMLKSHNFNKMTIYTAMFSPSDNIFYAYGFDTDMPYVHQ